MPFLCCQILYVEHHASVAKAGSVWGRTIALESALALLGAGALTIVRVASSRLSTLLLSCKEYAVYRLRSVANLASDHYR